MKKGLSLLLLVTLTLFTTVGVRVFAATGDESFVFHVRQMDDDYTNTGIGVWDGTNWNDYADVVTENDSFGGVITKTYTAADYVLVNNKTNVEFKPSRDVRITNAEPKNVLLAPGDGKVFANISALSDAEIDEVHLYYVEGSKKIFVAEPGLGQLMVVFGDPEVATDTDTYVGVTPTVTGNGTDGEVSALFDYVYEGALFDIPGKVFMISVDADAAAETSIAIGGKTYTFDNTNLKTGGANIIFIEKGQDAYQTSGQTWGASFELNYQLRAGNVFQPTTMVKNPTQIDAEFLMAKNPARLSMDRFTVTDGAGTVIPIKSITHAHSSKIGTYTPTVIPAAGQNLFVLHLDTNLDYTKVGLVGEIQGWNPDNAITASGLDSEGNAVFEAATVATAGGYKLLYNENYGDVGVKFAWGNYEITASNQLFDFEGESVLFHFIQSQNVGSFTSTKTAGVDQKMLVVHFDTTKDHTKLGLVGDVQGWNPSAAILATGLDSLGYAVFEVPTSTFSGSYKILYDATGTGFGWDNAATPNNINFSIGDNSQLVQYLNEATQSTLIMGGAVNHTPLDVKNFSLHFDATNKLSYGTEYTISYVEVVNPEELLESTVLPFNLSHNYVEGDFVESSGTLALNPKSIQVELNNRMGLVVSLLNSAKTAIAVESYTHQNPIGTYTYTVVPAVGQNLIRIHMAMSTTTITALNQIGLVGSVQGWNPSNAINPTGIDSEGNYVFEVTTADATGTIKFLYDANGSFNWGDPELTPGDVAIKLDGGTYLIEEGATSLGSKTHIMTLSNANKLSPTGTYYLSFTDANGFVVTEKLLVDNQAPTITAPLKPNVAFIIPQYAQFKVLDFFTTISVVDNVDGQMNYRVVKNINTANLGVQTFQIEAVDSWGNKATQSWQFTVGSGPVISLIQTTLSLQVNGSLPNWSNFATVDRGTLTVNSNQVDVTTPGTYYVIYTATDATGSNTRALTVTVIAPEVPPKTGCASSISGTSAIFMTFTIVLGGAVFFIVRKGRKVV